jgi:hypothetical protein
LCAYPSAKATLNYCTGIAIVIVCLTTSQV